MVAFPFFRVGVVILSALPSLASANPMVLQEVASSRGLQEQASVSEALQSAIGLVQSSLQSMLTSKLPASVGNCDADSPPAPCLPKGNLYEDVSDLYEVKAQWVGGLNTVKIKSIEVKPPSSSSNAIIVNMKIELQKLDLNLRLDACISVPAIKRSCGKIMENSELCCGGPIGINVDIKLACQTKTPYITSVDVADVQITPELVIQKTVGPVTLKVKDITSNVDQAIINLLNQSLKAEDVSKNLNLALAAFVGSADQVYCGIPPPTTKPKPPTTLPPTTPAPTTVTSLPNAPASNDPTTPTSKQNDAAGSQNVNTPRSSAVLNAHFTPTIYLILSLMVPQALLVALAMY